MNITIPENFHHQHFSYGDIPIMDIETTVFKTILHGVEYELDLILPRLENTIIDPIRTSIYHEADLT
jgi:hypothetical protein